MTRHNLWLALSLFVAACNNSGTMFHCYKPLPKEGWERCDTICFDVPEAKENIDGTLYVGLRTAAYIGIQDIVIAVEQAGEAGKLLRYDTIRYTLTDADGKALTGGVNKLQYETECLPFLCGKGKSISVRIHHLMRNELIPGITEVGIRVESKP